MVGSGQFGENFRSIP